MDKIAGIMIPTVSSEAEVDFGKLAGINKYKLESILKIYVDVASLLDNLDLYTKTLITSLTLVWQKACLILRVPRALFCGNTCSGPQLEWV